jgi:hypothetical protein
LSVLCRLTSALSGGQYTPRSGPLLLPVREEQHVGFHFLARLWAAMKVRCSLRTLPELLSRTEVAPQF